MCEEGGVTGKNHTDGEGKDKGNQREGHRKEGFRKGVVKIVQCWGEGK